MARDPLSPPLVSVIVPAFNAAATLGRALASVRAQTETRWEAIVIDDASGDGTPALVAAFEDPRVRYRRRSERGGPAAARNEGIALAEAALVAFLDADDEWAPEKLALQAAALDADPAVSLVVCDMHALFEDGRAGSSVFARQAPSEGGAVWKQLLASSFIGTSTAMTRRALLREIGGFDASLAVGEDQDLFIKLALKGKVVAFPQKLATYHYRASSYSAGLAADQARHVLRMVRRHLAAERGRLGAAERRRILAARYGRLGRNLIAAGARGRGAALILGAALKGSLPPENLSAIARIFL